MQSVKKIIRNLVKVIGFMAFILLIINTVFSNNRITARNGGARNYSWETVDD